MKIEELSHWKRVAYGFGDFGFNFYWTTVSFFILYFYTDVVGLSGTVAGAIFLVAMLWDGITDPVMGYLAQRTRSRWGCYRPYFLFGAIPLAASLVLTFYNPNLEGSALIASVLLAHMLFRTAYTAVNIPYSALSARITQSTEIRNSLAAWRMSFAAIGSSLVAYSTLRLVEIFGRGDDSNGFLLTAALYAGLSIPVFVILFFTVREPPVRIAASDSVGLREACAALLKNKPFLVIAAATILATLGSVIASKTLVYYFKYVLEDNASVGLAFATNSITILASVPIWAYITLRKSKRFVWRAGALISMTGLLLLFFNPYETVPVVVGISVLIAIGSAAGHLTFWSALPDTVEYGEMQNRRRSESLTFGVMGFIQKASYGVAAAIAGLLLDLIGYQANEVQTQSTLDAIKVSMSLVPAGFVFLAFMAVGMYRLDQTMHSRILMILRMRARGNPDGL